MFTFLYTDGQQLYLCHPWKDVRLCFKLFAA